MSDNLGMNLDHSEDYLDCPSDDKKVTDVVKGFDGDAIMKDLTNFISERKARQEERLKNRTVGDVAHDLTRALSGEKDDDVIEYYSSYDDHLALLDKEIEDQKARIIHGLERLELLIKKEQLIEEERDAVTSDNFQLPDYLKVNDDFNPLIKEHIFRFHRKLIGDFYGEYKYSSHAGKIPLERVYDCNGKIVAVRCMQCYRKFLRSRKPYATKNEGEIDLHDKVGEEK